MKKIFLKIVNAFPIIAILVLSLVIGCSKPANPDLNITNQLDRSDIIFTVARAGIGLTNVYVSDDKIIAPSKNWIETTYSQGLGKFLFDNGLEYKGDSFDCDDFASAAKTYSGILYFKTKNRPQFSGLSCFEFWYNRDGANGGGHAINGFIYANGTGGFELIFIEPQTQKIITLSKKEIASCKLFKM